MPDTNQTDVPLKKRWKGIKGLDGDVDTIDPEKYVALQYSNNDVLHTRIKDAHH